MKFNLHHYRALRSTQAKARELVTRGADEGTVVVAETQTQGVGRWDRRWASPPGGLWFTLILRPLTPVDRYQWVGLAAAHALTRVLSVNYGVRAGIRWPNDLLVQGRKLAGILTEAGLGPIGVEWGLLGMGVNTNLRLDDLPPEVRGEATTLLEILGRPIDNGQLLTRLLDEFWAYYMELRSGSIEALRRAIGRSLTPRRVLVETHKASYQGEVVGLDGQGRLVIHTGTETIALGPSDVVYLRPLMAKG